MFWFNSETLCYHGGDQQFGDIAVPERPSSEFDWIESAWIFNRERWLTEVIRPERDYRLDLVDVKYCNAQKWESMTIEQKTAWTNYKQALKDFTITIDPQNIVWPIQPE